MSPKGRIEVSYRWNLRMLMAAKGMFSTSDILPLLAERGVVLSREQVYRLVAKVPERLSLMTLAALCDILECSPSDLIEPVREAKGARKATASGAVVRDLKPRRARVAPRSDR